MKHFLVGLVAVSLGICGLVVWWRTFGMVMRGIVPFGLVVFGLLAVMSGYRRWADFQEGAPTTTERREPRV